MILYLGAALKDSIEICSMLTCEGSDVIQSVNPPHLGTGSTKSVVSGNNF